MCPVEFLRALLSGEKKYFYNHEVPVVYIQKLNKVTIKQVLKKAYNVPDIRVYLPDFDTHPERKMFRDFLFGIVNKLDPTFFKRAVRDAMDLQPKKPEDENKRKTLVVQPELLKIL